MSCSLNSLKSGILGIPTTAHIGPASLSFDLELAKERRLTISFASAAIPAFMIVIRSGRSEVS